MKSITSLVVVLLATLTCRAQEPVQKAEPPHKTPDYYPLKVGNKWHYLVVLSNGRKVVFLHQITKIEDVDGKRMARVETVVNGEIKSTEQICANADGVFRYRTDDVPYTPPACILKYPVKEGETWSAKLKIGDMPADVSSKSGSKEEVQVPSGTFQTIPVKTEMLASGSRVKITSWFAPEVGIVRQLIERQAGSVNMELLKFEAGK